MTEPNDELLKKMTQLSAGRLPGSLGIELLHVAASEVDARMAVTEKHWAPNNFLHAGAVVALADTACGVGSLASLPEGKSGFTTIELKTSFLRTATEGTLVAQARMRHGGSRTQIWDCEVKRLTDQKIVALFRCTQILLDAQDPRTTSTTHAPCNH